MSKFRFGSAGNNMTMELKSIYLSDNIIDESVDMLLRLSNSKSMPFDYYVIVVSPKDDEILMMLSSSEVNTDRFIEKNYHIVGFGKGKKDSLNLIRFMVQDAIDNTGDISKDAFLTISN